VLCFDLITFSPGYDAGTFASSVIIFLYVSLITEHTSSDVVVWDSHPLALGATPKQVWIDGIPQIDSPFATQKPSSFQIPPATPNFDKEAYEAIKYDGLPPIKMRRAKSDVVIFINVTSVFVRRQGLIHEVHSGTDIISPRTVVVEKGVVVCDGSELSCQLNYESIDAEWVNLEGGSLSCAGFFSFWLCF
jgi:hypothetical protein